jgi:S-adenosylmethionine:tRNA ribosyltransferase-isomerase
VAADPDGPRRLVRLDFAESPASVLERLGRLPLPPYIRRPDGPEDRDRYQTVYAAAPGAVAAPTAGLHFTAAMIEALKASGRGFATVTLRVGAGTFAPLTERVLAEGRLHEELAEVGEEAVAAIERCRSDGRKVVAVGTTVVRALEWAAGDGTLAPRKGGCSLFIRPGHEFKAIDGLITNFHLPQSSLMLLVAALAGRERLLAAYGLAVRERFRFSSYGDAMLIA